jgi:hypothetical protein
MTIPCATCEMRSGCERERRCFRPRTLDAANREWAEAIEAFRVAAVRLNNASKAVHEALKVGAQS